MAKHSRPTFSLRLFLAFCLGSGYLFGLGAYWMAMTAFLIAGLHLILLLVGALFADRFPRQPKPKRQFRFGRFGHVDDVPIIFVTCYLVFSHSWHLIPLVWFTLPGMHAFWFMTNNAGISLVLTEHLVLILMHVYVYVCYFGVCYGTGVVSQWRCVMTACFSVFLLTSHFAIPHT